MREDEIEEREREDKRWAMRERTGERWRTVLKTTLTGII